MASFRDRLQSAAADLFHDAHQRQMELRFEASLLVASDGQQTRSSSPMSSKRPRLQFMHWLDA